MNSWDAASKKIRQRKADIWRELLVETPFYYDPYDPDAYFSSYLTENIPGDPNIVLDRADRDRLWAAEIVITSQKFIHVLRLTMDRAKEGHITWAATDAHHAVLLGVRCFLATLGIGISQGKNRAHLVDYRPELGRPQDTKAFRKLYRGVSHPVRVLTPTPKTMEQKHIFELFGRMLGLVNLQDSDEFISIVDELKSLDLGSHKSERNRLLYHSDHWHWLDDLNWPAIDINIMGEVEKGADGLVRDFYALSLVGNLVFQSIKPLGEFLVIQETFFEPLFSDGACVSNTLSFLTP